MSYVTAENALETILQGVTGFSSANIKKGDYRVLGAGLDKALVMQPGPFTRENLSPGRVNNSWTINLELFIAFTGEVSTIATDIRTHRQNVIDKIDTFPTLNRAAGIMLGAVESGDEPELWAVGSHQWWRQVIRVTVKEGVTVSYAE